MSTTIKVIPGGPYVVTGDFELIDKQGNTLTKSENVHLCRCGTSANKPFCDGTHKKIGFKDE